MRNFHEAHCARFQFVILKLTAILKSEVLNYLHFNYNRVYFINSITNIYYALYFVFTHFDITHSPSLPGVLR